MVETYKAYKTLKQFSVYHGRCVRLHFKDPILRMDIFLNKWSIPHLLELQYMYQLYRKNNNIRYLDKDDRYVSGSDIFALVYRKLSDQKILECVRKHNPDQAKSVQDRIESFSLFMEKLEEGYLVSNLKAKSFGGKVSHFVIEMSDGVYSHLGIKREVDGDHLVSFKKGGTRLITYFQRGDNRYFSGSNTKINIVGIEIYDEKHQTYLPFSFNRESPFSLEHHKKVSLTDQILAWFHDPDYTVEQRQVLYQGRLNGLSDEQIAAYADSNVDYKDMHEARQALERGTSIETVRNFLRQSKRV